MLTGAQRAAVATVRARAAGECRATETLTRLLEPTGHRPAALLAAIRHTDRVTVNFHPDRLIADGRSVVQALAEDGVYRSQFETAISNGGRFAYPGGPRDVWEHELFGGAYQRTGVRPADRPKYGGLNLMDHPDGACPRFGSCYLRLHPAVPERVTFCVGDSHLGPLHVGTADRPEPVLVALLTAAAAGASVCGVDGLDVPALAERLVSQGFPVRGASADVASRPPGRALDDYVEVQVHGPIEVTRDVAAVVADPAFRGTTTGAELARVAERGGIPLHWHGGFAMEVSAVPAELRGPAIPLLAQRIHADFAAPGDPVDAVLIGRAAQSLVREPDRWRDWASPDETLQHLKQLWHVLVHDGHPHR